MKAYIFLRSTPTSGHFFRVADDRPCHQQIAEAYECLITLRKNSQPFDYSDDEGDKEESKQFFFNSLNAPE